MKVEEIPVWEAFVAVAKHGGFSSASTALGVAVPQVSKRIAKLESDLGVRLFQRTTRAVSLTDEGLALLPRVVGVLEDLSNIEAALEPQGNISGTLRITSIPFIAQRLLLPLFTDFMRKHPGIRIELDISDHMVNLIESQIDLAVRIQEPTDTNLVYRKLIPNQLVLCASPLYLKTHKKPLTEPKHLRDHDVLMLDIHRSVKFKDQSTKLSDVVGQQKFSCNKGWYLTELAKNNCGILVRSIWDVQPLFASGELVPVLKKYPLGSFGNIYAVIPSRRYLAPRVRTFMDFLVERAAKWSH